MKLTVFFGVLRVAWLRLRADRVMSCNWRPALDSAVRDAFLEFRGVKKRVKRLGVMGGGRFCLREPVVAVKAGGDDGQSSGVGSWNAVRGAHGEDMLLHVYIQKTPMDHGQPRMGL